jgi:hypothetical protein
VAISAPRSPIKASGIPYTIIRSTQFLEFLRAIAASSVDGNMVRISPGLFQPIAADDVAAIVADVALAAPRNGIVEIAGPERAQFNEIVARFLKAVGDPREVVSDPRGPILRRLGRGALAGAVGRGAPWPHRSRRMAPPLTGSTLIPVPPTERLVQTIERISPVNCGRHANMSALFRRIKRNALAMSTLRILGTALVLAFGSQPIPSARAAESAVVTPLMLKELADISGKELLMITVDYPPGAVDPVRICLRPARLDCHAGAGR